MKNRLITLLLIALNVAVFCGMVYSEVSPFDPTAEHILEWGGCNSHTLLHGQWWRLLSSTFVHFGMIHLLMNVYALFYIGSNLEPLIGKARFATVYLATAIFGGLVSQIWHLDSYTLEAGASGGVFGIIGVLFALLTTKLLPEEVRSPHLKQIFIMIVVNLMYGLKSEVNMAAHMGGLLSGCLMGYGLYPSLTYGKIIIKRATLALIALVTVISSAGILHGMKNSDSFRFDEITSEMDSLQNVIINLHKDIPSLQIEAIAFFDSEILPEWKKGAALADRAGQLQLEGDKAKHRDYLVKHFSLYSKKYHLCGQAMRENTHAYDSAIKQVENELSKLDEKIRVNEPTQ